MKINFCFTIAILLNIFALFKFLKMNSNKATTSITSSVEKNVKNNQVNNNDTEESEKMPHIQAEFPLQPFPAANAYKFENADIRAELPLQPFPSANAYKFENADPNNLWDKLFISTKQTNCEKTRVYDLIVKDYYNKYERKNLITNKFNWIKKWGEGPVAYLFDYLDSVLRNDILEEFKGIFKNITSYSNIDNKEYQDTLNMNTYMNDVRLRIGYSQKIKDYNNRIKTSYFKSAVNTVQLRQAIPALGWIIPNKDDDYAKKFVLNYDIDGDGRLNARELILGSIIGNKGNFKNKNCKLCFDKTISKIDKIFDFINCAKNGFIDAEQMWESFPLLIRNTSMYNIFSIRNDMSIRTNAVNDLVLKNVELVDGFLSKEEFRIGILLGFWDRQTTESGIIDGDSRNLKSLRWSDDGMTDTIAYESMKEQIILDLEAKAEERKRNMVKYKDQFKIRTPDDTNDFKDHNYNDNNDSKYNS